MKTLLFYITVITCSLSADNFFKLSLSTKSGLTSDDYERLQEQMRQIKLDDIYERLSIDNPGLFVCNRVEVGHRLKLIDTEKGLLPETHLIKIGKGGECCIVTYASFNRQYADLARSIAHELEAVGFDGYFYCRIGGYPNPTGIETQYAAVPYAFKIFTILEAVKLRDFSHVLWIDAALLPLRNPAPIFEEVSQKGYFFNVIHNFDSFREVIPSTTRLFLSNFFKHDYLLQKEGHINMTVFGLDMRTSMAHDFFKTYYELVDLGHPFVSGLPEEYVISYFFNQPKYRLELKMSPLNLLVRVPEETPYYVELQRKDGFFFLARRH